MSSLQPQEQQQPQQQQQPVLVYPNNVRKQPSSHHSNGSFGTVFIVLAVIIVISAIACFLGRLCNRRHLKAHNSKPKKQSSSTPKFRPSNKEPAAGYHHDMEFGNNNHSFRVPKDADIEFGFDKKIPNGNGSRSDSNRGYMKGDHHHMKAETKQHSKPYNNGNGDHHHMKGEMKYPGDHVVIGEPRASG